MNQKEAELEERKKLAKLVDERWAKVKKFEKEKYTEIINYFNKKNHNRGNNNKSIWYYHVC